MIHRGWRREFPGSEAGGFRYTWEYLAELYQRLALVAGKAGTIYGVIEAFKLEG